MRVWICKSQLKPCHHSVHDAAPSRSSSFSLVRPRATPHDTVVFLDELVIHFISLDRTAYGYQIHKLDSFQGLTR